MTDKEYADQKLRLTKLANKWIQALGLRWWTVNFAYNRDTVENRDDGRCSVASTMVDWEYLNATITFEMQAVSEQPDSDLEYQFVHECCHILVNEMRMWGDREMDKEKHDEAMKHEERVVTTLANAFMWTREAGRADAPKSDRTPKRKQSARK